MLPLLNDLESRLRTEFATGRAGKAVRSLLLSALDEGPHAVGVFDQEDRLAYGNRVLRDVWCVAEAQTFDEIFRNCHAQRKGAIVDTADIEAWLQRARTLRRSGTGYRGFEVDFWDGRWFWVTERVLQDGWLLFIGQDITAVKQSENALLTARDAALEASLTDHLTGLPNRRSATRHLEERLAGDGELSLALVDIDRFKHFNDTYGHGVGDELLIAFGDRLTQASEGCMVARLAGDEFAVISGLQTGVEVFRYQVARLLQRQSEPLRLAQRDLSVGISVGIATAPRDAQSVGELLAAADAAMYVAKQGTRESLCVFNPDMGRARRLQADLRGHLAAAFEREEFVPYYQPIVDLQTGRIVKLEILARWQHPSRGLLPPDDFIPLLASAEQMTQLTRSLLTQAIRDMADSDVSMAFNVAAQQLTHDILPPLLTELQRDTGISLSRLEMEVTEAALAEDPATARKVVSTIRAMGLNAALDDFGVGFSSLKQLHDIDFDRLKLDRSFVRDLIRNERDRRFVGSIIDLAKSLGLSIVAEGIEDAETGAALAKMGCRLGQGYYFGRPMPVAETRWLLSSQTRADGIRRGERALSRALPA